MKKFYTFLSLFLLLEANAIEKKLSVNDPAIEANHIRKIKIDNKETLPESVIKNFELSLDNDLENFTKFKGSKKEFKKISSSVLKYRTKKIIPKGALLRQGEDYYVSPRTFLAMVSHDPKEYYSEILDLYDKETYYIRNIDLISTDRFFDLNEKPDHKISYPKKLFNKKYYEKFPFLFKFDLQTEVFKEGYLDELSTSTTSENQVSSLAAGIGASFHLVTDYDFILNFGLSSFIHVGTWISGFEKTTYQSLYLGPEVLLKLGNIEGLNVYGICELTRSLYNSISDTDNTINIFLRNSSIKLALELKSKTSGKSTWYTGAYYRLIESSLGRETSNDVAKPRYRKNSNAYGLYFGRTFDFYW